LKETLFDVVSFGIRHAFHSVRDDKNCWNACSIR
jgi:hypothetical protein